jgi:hypothetical protein
MEGDMKMNAAQIAATNPMLRNSPIRKSNGSETSVTAGIRAETATNVVRFGLTRSL